MSDDDGRRSPQATKARRIEPLANLPVFWRLRARRVVLAGAGEGAVWKAELLAAAGADLVVYAGDGAADYTALAADPPDGRITVLDRDWTPEDLAGAALALADVATEDEACAFAAAARRHGVPVNVVDKPEFCDFQFGSIVNRSPLIVSISTDGAAPVFGQEIRARIEAALPIGLKAWAQAAKDWRPAVQARELPFALRRRVWERFTRLAMQAIGRAPTAEDRDALLAGIDSEGTVTGRVSLVGAGPGDPELLTLKAVRTLQAADVILYDDLVSPEVLDLARREAKRMLVGKKGHGPSCKQDDINHLMVQLARQGKHVVRLKSGDPLVFGRAGEEVAACRAAGLPVTVVPGISAAQGAAAAIEAPLTHRGEARRLQFLTGHGLDGKLPQDVVWPALADPAATTVVYMPRHTLAELRERAIAAGLDPATPAIAIMSATTPRQRRLDATIGTLPERLAEWPSDGPVLVMIGRAMARAAAVPDAAASERATG